MSNHKYNTEHNGFTLVEILVVAPIVILAIGVFITMIVTMTGDIMASRGANSLAYNVQDALSRIEQDVKHSGAFLATNNIITTPQGYDNAVAPFDNANTDTAIGPMLILNVYTTTSNPVSPTRNIVYTKNPNACGSNLKSQNPPVMMNVVYFIKNNTLWRRTLAKTGYNDITNITCDVPWQQPSCYPGISGTICKAQDIKLVDGVSPNSGLTINYYPTPSSDTPNAVASDGSVTDDTTRLAALQSNSTVKVTINAASTIAGRDTNFSSSIRATSPNNYIWPN